MVMIMNSICINQFLLMQLYLKYQEWYILPADHMEYVIDFSAAVYLRIVIHSGKLSSSWNVAD